MAMEPTKKGWEYASHFSYTRFNLYETCPFAYAERYIRKKKDRVGAPALMGRLCHEIAAEYDRHLLKMNAQTDITVLPEITRRLFYQNEKGQPRGLPMEALDEVMEIMETFGQMHIFNPDTTVDIEEPWQFELDPDTLFWVVIDRLEIDGHRAKIVDYKTEWKIKSQDELKKDKQLRIYAWAVITKYPQVTEVQAQLEYLRHGVVLGPVELNPDDAASIEEDIRDKIAQIKSTTKFEATPGEGCSWCSYIESCPALKEMGDVVCTSAEDAQRIHRELLLLEKQVEDRKEALKAWCTVHGPIETNGVARGFFATTTKSINDKAKFYELLKQHGENPLDYMSVDNRRAKKLEKKPELAEALADRKSVV